MNTIDPRLTAFLSQRKLDIFHPVIHHGQIWHPEAHDVETIHSSARSVYEYLINRVDRDRTSDSGRILLLLGESGAGKTHLMRVFRNQTQAQNKGFFSYMQMGTAVSNYAQYVLRNTIDSFDKPYCEPFGPTTGLMKLSNALADDSQVMKPRELELLRDENLTREELFDLIYPVADRIVGLERFSGVDLDLVRALLYLQPRQAATDAKVFKLLRCEPLADYDSKALGGMTARNSDDDPMRMLQSLAMLIQAVTDGVFVICLDQLDEIHGMDAAEHRFRRAVQTIVTLAEIPNVVVVLSCLDDLYISLKSHLPQSHLDRLELDPPPIKLVAQRSESEVNEIITRRLQYLYELADLEIEEPMSLYPFPEDTATRLAGYTTRGILEWCRSQQENTILTGNLPSFDGDLPGQSTGTDPDVSALSQLWNDHVTGNVLLPESDRDLLHLLSHSIKQCERELGQFYQFTVEIEGDYLTADIRIGPDMLHDSLWLGLCQKAASGGALAKQIHALTAAAGDRTPVILRTTEFPSNPKTKIAQQIGQFLTAGGRRAIITDSDWRIMAALQSFRAMHGERPDFQPWLQTEQPLSQLSSLQKILALSQLRSTAPIPTLPTHLPQPSVPPMESAATTESDPVNTTPLDIDSPSDTATSLSSTTAPIFNGIGFVPPKPIPPATLPDSNSAIVLGMTRSAAPHPVKVNVGSFLRHGAFLGGTGSGKTTLALMVIEQLLLRGIPAILLDRKGDLCSYANPEAWVQLGSDPAISAQRQLLRDHIKVAVYTPGTVGGQGRPLSIAITPSGLSQLPEGERRQIANYCATALGGVMNYKQSAQDKRIAILGQAIAILSELHPDAPVSIDQLIEFIDDADPLLVNAIGALDPKHCKKLAEDLQTLSLMAGHLFNTQYEQLSVEKLLSKPSPQQTQLSIINLGSLGDNANILFWVSQLLLDLNRYAQKNPSEKLQAVVLFDEADLYLPAQSKPSTKEPMEGLLKRARSAGIGLLLSTQSPGDLDYKCRDQILSWFVGKIQQDRALDKLKPMLSEVKTDITGKLANQKVGEFFVIQSGEVESLKACMSLVKAMQVPIEDILALAATLTI